mmetsp:Transcript_5652/g.8939  ORF Transcript_5652/g.8939 Transcript_5652/m.8939 type:complete len:185 (+) Transcript_5652:5010-5564(+)
MYTFIITTLSFIIQILENQSNDEDHMDNAEAARQGVTDQIIQIFKYSLRLEFMEIPELKLTGSEEQTIAKLHGVQMVLLFLVWIIVQIFLPILFLNIFIAIISNTYMNVKGQKEYQRYLDMAQLNYDTNYIFKVLGGLRPITQCSFSVLERAPELVGGFEAIDDNYYRRSKAGGELSAEQVEEI